MSPPVFFSSVPVSMQPDRKLLTYYVLSSLLLGPFFLFWLVPMYFRYHTLRYEIDDEGISMRWGILFRREVSLAFARIQDIHLTSNVMERWLGLGKIQIQTASGSASAEMTIEGVLAYEALRDFLYQRMRGARDGRGVNDASSATLQAAETTALTEAIQAAANEIRAVRELVENRARAGG